LKTSTHPDAASIVVLKRSDVFASCVHRLLNVIALRAAIDGPNGKGRVQVSYEASTEPASLTWDPWSGSTSSERLGFLVATSASSRVIGFALSKVRAAQK
jgi:hypothetical protein